jgi:hypothetical protein
MEKHIYMFIFSIKEFQMNKFYILLVIAISLTTAYSQELEIPVFQQQVISNDDYVFDNFIVYNSGDTRRFSISYNSDKTMSEILIEMRNQVSWTKAYKLIYTYDENKSNVSTIAQQWANNNWGNFYRNVYTYDANNFLETQTFERWQSNNWLPSSKMFYTNDINGNDIIEVVTSWTGTSWDSTNRRIFTYDADNNQLSGLYQKFNLNQWENTLRILKTYGTKNNELTYKSFKWLNGDWVNSQRGSIVWDAGEVKKLSDHYEQYVDSQWAIILKPTLCMMLRIINQAM